MSVRFMKVGDRKASPRTSEITKPTATTTPANQKYIYSNAYLNFMIDFREKIKNDGLKQTEIIRQGAAAWNKLDAEQKKPYNEAAMANRKDKPTFRTTKSFVNKSTERKRVSSRSRSCKASLHSKSTETATSSAVVTKRSKMSVSSVSDRSAGSDTEIDEARSTASASSAASVTGSRSGSATGSSDGYASEKNASDDAASEMDALSIDGSVSEMDASDGEE